MKEIQELRELQDAIARDNEAPIERAWFNANELQGIAAAIDICVAGLEAAFPAMPNVLALGYLVASLNNVAAQLAAHLEAASEGGKRVHERTAPRGPDGQ